MQNLIYTIYAYSGILLVCKSYNSGLQIMPLIQTILDLWSVLILEAFGS